MSNEDFTADLTMLCFNAVDIASISTALVKFEQLEMNPKVEISIKWGTILRFPASEEPREEMFLYLFDL